MNDNLNNNNNKISRNKITNKLVYDSRTQKSDKTPFRLISGSNSVRVDMFLGNKKV